MKLLVIGIDGGTQKILEGMPMPFTQKLFSQSRNRVLKEDLLSRGWPEILTGEHASNNKSFYLMPPCDKSYNFSQQYNREDMLSPGQAMPIWNRLNQSNVSVGLLNIPTTGPVDRVNGFMVAGGGGGLSPTSSIAPEMIYPPEHKTVLENHGYIFDIREPGEVTTVSGYLKKIEYAEKVQKNTFIDLAKNIRPDFGFHCFRITTVVQYLLRHEIEKCIAAIRQAKELGLKFEPQSSIQQALIDHYVHLDNSIKELFDTLQPESYFFLADHSTSLFEFEGNLDVWLEEAGYLEKMSGSELWLSRLRNVTKRKLRPILTRFGLTKPLPPLRRPITRFSRHRTRAFGTFYDYGNFAGIFINDRDRFGGPVNSGLEIDHLVDEICKKFNQLPEAKQYVLEAKPYRREFAGAKYQNLMPDIRIHKPDTIYFSGRHWQFMRPNPNLGPMEEDLTGIRYPYTGLKGSDPLFVFSPDLESCIKDDDPNDLRTAYRIICRYFENANI